MKKEGYLKTYSEDVNLGEIKSLQEILDVLSNNKRLMQGFKLRTKTDRDQGEYILNYQSYFDASIKEDKESKKQEKSKQLYLAFDTNTILLYNHLYTRINEALAEALNVHSQKGIQHIVNYDRLKRDKFERRNIVIEETDKLIRSVFPEHTQAFAVYKVVQSYLNQMENFMQNKDYNYYNFKLAMKIPQKGGFPLFGDITISAIQESFWQKLHKTNRYELRTDWYLTVCSILINVFEENKAVITFSEDKDVEAIAKIFAYEIIPRYFAKQDINASEIRTLLMQDQNKQQEKQKMKEIIHLLGKGVYSVLELPKELVEKLKRGEVKK